MPKIQISSFYNTLQLIYSTLQHQKYQRRIILIAVCLALLLDNMLYMVIVPIIPDYLRTIGAWSTHRVGGRVEFRSNNSRLVPLRIGGKIVYEGEDSGIGLLFATKAAVQLLVNPISGTIIDHIGYDIPMMIGLTVMFLSTSLFACGNSYGVLFIARSLQGVGSAFADTGGLAMIADRFVEEKERQKALGIALTFISFGCLCAPPFGGLLYEFCGKELPFIVLALVCLLDGILVLIVMSPVKAAAKAASNASKTCNDNKNNNNNDNNNDKLEKKGTPIHILLQDRLILVCAGSLAMANVSLAFLEPTMSIWMKDTMNVEEWQIGLVWLPAFIPYVGGVYTTVELNNRYPLHTWLITSVGLALSGISCLLIPFSKSFLGLFAPIGMLCFGVAQVDTAVLPTLGYLVDTRYVSVYGSIYAIADISYNVAYAIGPIVAGNIFELFGFTILNIIIAISNLAYCPVLMMLKGLHSYEDIDRTNNIEKITSNSDDGNIVNDNGYSLTLKNNNNNNSSSSKNFIGNLALNQPDTSSSRHTKNMASNGTDSGNIVFEDDPWGDGRKPFNPFIGGNYSSNEKNNSIEMRTSYYQ